MTFPSPIYQSTNAFISPEVFRNTYGLRYCHYYGMVNDLPTYGNEIGDIYYLANSGTLCIYTKDSWKILNDESIENVFQSV